MAGILIQQDQLVYAVIIRLYLSLQHSSSVRSAQLFTEATNASMTSTTWAGNRPQEPHQHWKLSQSRGNTRSKSRVHFLIGIPPSKYLYKLYTYLPAKGRTRNCKRLLLLLSPDWLWQLLLLYDWPMTHPAIEYINPWSRLPFTRTHLQFPVPIQKTVVLNYINYYTILHAM